jgi:hypothetical protein
VVAGNVVVFESAKTPESRATENLPHRTAGRRQRPTQTLFVPVENRPAAVSLRWAIAGLLAFSLFGDEPQDQPEPESRVKAAFLLNFTRFVEWPAAAFSDPAAPFTICVLGPDPFGDTLDQLVEGESASGRKLEVKRIQQPPAARTCQLVFVGRSEKEAADMINGLGPGVLTVGESERFLRAGGMIAFVVAERRVRFDINNRAASKALLVISSRLLGVARAVQK